MLIFVKKQEREKKLTDFCCCLGYHVIVVLSFDLIILFFYVELTKKLFCFHFCLLLVHQFTIVIRSKDSIKPGLNNQMLLNFSALAVVPWLYGQRDQSNYM